MIFDIFSVHKTYFLNILIKWTQYQLLSAAVSIHRSIIRFKSSSFIIRFVQRNQNRKRIPTMILSVWMGLIIRNILKLHFLANVLTSHFLLNLICFVTWLYDWHIWVIRERVEPPLYQSHHYVTKQIKEVNELPVG